MMCESPVAATGGQHVPCGQCPSCRVNLRRVWKTRILLEKMQFKNNTFVTLTYNEDNVPRTSSDLMTLRRDDFTKFMKRFRRKIQPMTVRQYGVGEYGDESFRPHYHVALFGYHNCNYGISRYRLGFDSCCRWCDIVRECWGHGFIELRDLDDNKAGYICGYVTKKLTKAYDPRLEGREPEFSAPSRNPGVGVSALWEVADVLMRYDEVEWDDVPVHLRFGSRLLPLGRFMRGKLRLMVGMETVNVPKAAQIKKSEEMYPMRLFARQNEEGKSLKEIIVEVNEGRVAKRMANEEIFRKRSKI